MNEYVRIFSLIVFFILVFVFSWMSVDHLDDVRVINEAEEIVELKAENDSLRTVIETLSVSDSTEVPNE